MPDNNTVTVIEDVNKDTDKNLNTDIDSNNGNDKTVPLSTFLELKKEIKSYKEKLEKIDTDTRKAEEDKLKAQGELQKLLDAKEKEIEDLNKTLKPKADAFEQFKVSKIEQAKKTLGDKWDEEYSNLSLTALDKIINTISAKNPDPNPDGGPNGKKAELTDNQKIEAKTMGLSDEQYLEVMSKRKAKQQ